MFLVDLPARQLQQEDESQGFVATGGANTTRFHETAALSGAPLEASSQK